MSNVSKMKIWRARVVDCATPPAIPLDGSGLRLVTVVSCSHNAREADIHFYLLIDSRMYDTIDMWGVWMGMDKEWSKRASTIIHGAHGVGTYIISASPDSTQTAVGLLYDTYSSLCVMSSHETSCIPERDITKLQQQQE